MTSERSGVRFWLEDLGIKPERRIGIAGRGLGKGIIVALLEKFPRTLVTKNGVRIYRMLEAKRGSSSLSANKAISVEATVSLNLAMPLGADDRGDGKNSDNREEPFVLGLHGEDGVRDSGIAGLVMLHTGC